MMEYLKAIYWHGISAATFTHPGALKNKLSGLNFATMLLVAGALTCMNTYLAKGSVSSALVALFSQTLFLYLTARLFSVSMAVIITCMEVFHQSIRIAVALAAPGIYETVESVLVGFFITAVFVLSRRSATLKADSK